MLVNQLANQLVNQDLTVKPVLPALPAASAKFCAFSIDDLLYRS